MSFKVLNILSLPTAADFSHAVLSTNCLSCFPFFSYLKAFPVSELIHMLSPLLEELFSYLSARLALLFPSGQSWYAIF